MKKIAFLYSSYLPIKGGGSVHGFNLAKGLAEKGYKLYTFNRVADNFTVNKKKSLSNIINTIFESDLVYIRLNLKIDVKYLLLFLSKVLGKKIIIELNSPSDELRLSGANDFRIKVTDFFLKIAAKMANHLIVVSENVKQYCEEILKSKCITVIPNGGKKFSVDENKINNDIKIKISSIKKKYKKIAIWSGTKQPWQGYELIKEIIKKSNSTIAFIIISNDTDILEQFKINENVSVFSNLNREELKYITINCNIGFAIYSDIYYDFCKYGFYGSSIKYFEYLFNGLFVIATPDGQMMKKKYDNLFLSRDVNKILTTTYNLDTSIKYDTSSCRSWDDVANETDKVIKNVLMSKNEK
jgi:glycosyltransferase involved in cell wall biosynthesis